MTARILLRDHITDFTGSVISMKDEMIEVMLITGLNRGSTRSFLVSAVVTIVEILFFPIVHRIRRAVSGEQEGVKNLTWTKVPCSSKNSEYNPERKPKMLLEAPGECKHKRCWHFFEIFPTKEFEFCTKVQLRSEYNDERFTNFNTVAYFAA